LTNPIHPEREGRHARRSPIAPGAKTASRIDIGIADKDRAAIAARLSKLLADTYTLYLMTHNFRWNVTGPMFNTLHLMFMEQCTELWNAADPIAERNRSLGHHAPRLVRAVRQARLDRRRARNAAEGARDGRHPRCRARSHGANGAPRLPPGDAANDEPTADLLTPAPHRAGAQGVDAAQPARMEAKTAPAALP
jgi:starvation-inducible DNA-binding protein